jgi:hypothetical protein
MSEPRLVHPDPINAHLQGLPHQMIKRWVSIYSMIDCIDNKWPVHRFIAIEEMALKDKSQDILVVTSGMDVNVRRKKFRPIVFMFSNVASTSTNRERTIARLDSRN